MLALRFYGTVLTYPKSQRVPHSPRFLLVRGRHPMTSVANPILVEPHDAYSGYSGGVGGSPVRSTTWAGLTAWGGDSGLRIRSGKPAGAATRSQS